MKCSEMILKYSAELREWAHTLGPVLSALIAGWHIPQPKWMKKKVEQKEEG